MKKFGKFPKQRTFSPPKATRGGNTSFFKKEKEENLSGKINGLKAAQGEERLARALDRRIKAGTVRTFYFRSSPGMQKSNATLWRELDFEIFTLSGTMAVSVEGSAYVHRGESKRNQDKLNEVLLMSRLAKVGRPVAKIERVFDYELKDQAGAETVLKRLGIR
jgi:hypothetical protein